MILNIIVYTFILLIIWIVIINDDIFLNKTYMGDIINNIKTDIKNKKTKKKVSPEVIADPDMRPLPFLTLKKIEKKIDGKENKNYDKLMFCKNKADKNIILKLNKYKDRLGVYTWLKKCMNSSKYLDSRLKTRWNNGIKLIEISYIVGTYAFTWGVLQIFSGLYSDYIGRNLLIITGMLICIITLPLCLLSFELSWWLACSFLLGVGMAMLYPSISSAVNDNCDDSWRASGIGIYRFWRDTGYATGALLIGIVTSVINIEAGFIFVSFSMILSTLILILTIKKYG